MSTVVILGSGFDIDLGLRNSCADFSKNRLCPIAGNRLWSAFENTLRQEVILWYNNGMDEQKAEELNGIWREYVKNISYFFTEKSDDFIRINQKGRRAWKVKNTCAYRFLKQLKTSKVYTFNYTSPYEYVDVPCNNEFIHIHGRHYKDTFNKELLVMSQGPNIIFGIDECIPEDGINNTYINPMIKKNHRVYKETNIVADLLNAECVVFYGFSMGDIDYGYFEEFFQAINNGSSRCKSIYYVTYKKKDYRNFVENLKTKNIWIDKAAKRVPIIPIYTSKSFKNRDFRIMLRRL